MKITSGVVVFLWNHSSLLSVFKRNNDRSVHQYWSMNVCAQNSLMTCNFRVVKTLQTCIFSKLILLFVSRKYNLVEMFKNRHEIVSTNFASLSKIMDHLNFKSCLHFLSLLLRSYIRYRKKELDNPEFFFKITASIRSSV